MMSIKHRPVLIVTMTTVFALMVPECFVVMTTGYPQLLITIAVLLTINFQSNPAKSLAALQKVQVGVVSAVQ